MAVLSRDKTDVSLTGEASDRGKKMADRWVFESDLESWSVLDSGEVNKY